MFGFLKKKKQPEPDLEKLIEIADILSKNNPTLHTSMVYCLDETFAYSRQYAERYAQRGIDAEHCDRDTLCWIALADELESSGDLVSVDTACEAEDLRWSLSQLNLVKKMNLAVPEPKAEGFYGWLEEYRQFFWFEHGLVLCEFCMDSDDYELTILSKEQHLSVYNLALLAGHTIDEVEIP